jgi:hypothetical protein
LSERLTDGGYEDDSAYCLYARKNYRKGEQVYYQSQHCHITFLFFFSFALCFIHFCYFL